jgi:PiT family inorganic phosphate transporter
VAASPHLLGGLYMGWALGANDAANVFGTAVASRMLRFRTAALLCSVFVLAGAWFEGQEGLHTIGKLAGLGVSGATFTTVGAAVAMTLMTWLAIPSSTSQALVGSLIAVGLMTGHPVALGALSKVIACWVTTPIGGLLFAMLFYRLLGAGLNRLKLDLFTQDMFLRTALVFAGCYGAYALGANNVANVTGVYFGAGMLSGDAAVLIGAGAIALGVISYSHKVMLAVGRSIVSLDAFSALVVVLAEALTVHIYAWIGVPVSTSQAVVGAVLGVGLVKQASAVRFAVIGRIALGWLATPLVAAAVSAAIFFCAHLRYVN